MCLFLLTSFFILGQIPGILLPLKIVKVVFHAANFPLGWKIPSKICSLCMRKLWIAASSGNFCCLLEKTFLAEFEEVLFTLANQIP